LQRASQIDSRNPAQAAEKLEITIMHRRAFLAAATAMAMVPAGAVLAADTENTLFLDTKNGRVTLELLPKVAPKHVKRIKELTRKGFYDGLKFHRVIAGFMAQTGDPRGDGTGGSDLADVEAEFSQEPFGRGTVGMARAQDPNSANSQFFICFGDASFLNGQYTVFARVTDGMDVVDRIKKGDANDNGSVAEPDVIVKMQVAADAK
jgi:peptidylprolyl isomerase